LQVIIATIYFVFGFSQIQLGYFGNKYSIQIKYSTVKSLSKITDRIWFAKIETPSQKQRLIG